MALVTGTKQRVVASVAGWEDSSNIKIPTRMIVSLRGEERSGKTQFGLTAPGPIAVVPFDNNTLEIVAKMRRFKNIIVPPKGALNYKDATNKDEYLELWEMFKVLFTGAVEAKEVRSILVDTATEAWELLRLARFGKLTQIMPTAYTEVNNEFNQLINKVKYDTDKNLVLIHRLKDQYKGNNRTGERIVSGYADIGYRVQLNVLCWRDLEYRNEETGSQGFGITIDDCTQNEEMAGTFLLEPENTWTALGMKVYPGTTAADWK